MSKNDRIFSFEKFLKSSKIFGRSTNCIKWSQLSICMLCPRFK